MMAARTHHMRRRFRRGLVVPLALVGYCFFVLLDAQHFFALLRLGPPTQVQDWVHLGFSALTAFLFLIVGILVWLYARKRPVAWLLFVFCLAMMVSFASSTAAKLNDPLFSALGSVSSGIALLAFSTLVLYFPHDFVANAGRGFALRRWALRAYMSALLLFGLLVVPTYAVMKYVTATVLPPLLDSSYHSVFALALLGITSTLVAAYRRATTSRKRQQLRLFVVGVVLAFTPVLLLTVLPAALSLPAQFVVDSQLSTITVVLLPLTLGYSALRYQILLFDTAIRRAASWIVGSLGMGMLVYLVIILFDLFRGAANIAIVLAVIGAALGGTFVWWGMHRLTDRFFFAEQAHFRKVIEDPALFATERLDMNKVAHLLEVAAEHLFGTQASCLFVLDGVTGRYCFVPTAGEEDVGYADQQELLAQLCRVGGVEDACLDERHPLVQRLAAARRPFSLSEATGSAGLARYLAAAPSETESDPLVIPIRASDAVIGLLVAGKRGDQQLQYAGPEFEAANRLQARLAPALETARLYDQAHRRAETMNALYSGIRPAMMDSPEALMANYAEKVAAAFQARAEFWLYNQATHQLRRIVQRGVGPHLVAVDCQEGIQETDFHPWFSQQGARRSSEAEPACLRRYPHDRPFPYAWLPLEGGEHVIGVFTLAFDSSHYFSPEEQRDLTQLAGKCAAEIERANMTVALVEALAQQKELDRLKDQFIMTASHELRTPLTAVEGYLELLNEYGANLDEDTRAHFLATARRSCNELVLMVENIMNAGTLQTGAIPFTIEPVRLEDPVKQVIEILDGNFDREGREIHLDVPAGLLVLGDQMRLRQVFLNLLTNALKYSPAGSPLAIAAAQESADTLTVRVRDHGAGVPQQEREAIFEAFVRLERDMNSPVRGAGLGLSLCRQLIEGMGGRIWVESTGVEGEGSSFCFTLKTAPGTQEFEAERYAGVGQG